MAKRIKDPTERLVMKLFNQGLSNKEIAKKAGIFVSEVKRILKLHQVIRQDVMIHHENTGVDVNPTIIEEMYTGGTLVEFKNGSTLIQKDNDMIFVPGGGLVAEDWKEGSYDTQVQTSLTSPLTVDIYPTVYKKELTKLLNEDSVFKKKSGLDCLFDGFTSLFEGFYELLGIRK